MSIYFVRNDITKMEVDAIVLPANEELVMGRGASTSIFMAAGKEKLTKACRDLGHCEMGKCKVTSGFDLPAEYILHTVVPLWEGGDKGEEEHLRSAYESALSQAADMGLKSVAFPVLSSGNFGYPKEEALDVCVSEMERFLEDKDMELYVVLFGESIFRAAGRLTDSIEEYIDNNYVEEQEQVIYPEKSFGSISHGDDSGHRKRLSSIFNSRNAAPTCEEIEEECIAVSEDVICSIKADLVMPCGAAYSEIPTFDPEKSFIDTLYDRIEERGLTDPQCYNSANIDRKLFNKIKNSPGYTPKKNTIFALCIGLRLSLPEAEDLLKRAGYAISPCSRFDLAVEYFLKTGDYRDIHDVNIAHVDMFEKTLN